MKLGKYVWIGAFLALWMAGCSPSPEKQAETGQPGDKIDGLTGGAPPPPGDSTAIASSTGLTDLVKEDVKVGTGAVAAAGDLALVSYRGTFKDGKVFDTNIKADGAPFTFVIGAGNVIKGWDLGVEGMKVGGVRKLSIPYSLAYGEGGQGETIPPKSDLFFEITLHDLVKKGEENVFDKEDVKVGTGPEAQEDDIVSVQYDGKLVNGKKFDSSRDRKEPFEFQVGGGTVIPGWDSGVRGMKKGGIRKLRIPPAIAYGAQSPPGIGPNQVLLFEIEVLEIRKKGSQ